MCPHGWDLREQFCVACASPEELRDKVDALQERIEEDGEEIARLRGVIAQVEEGGQGEAPGHCHWCGAYRATKHSLSPTTPHAADCPAFTPDGAVR